ncbi:hypothetical protein [Hufsiella ginkgonis]|uniref:Uncharacterized protein n=1 Tax=Hufsiella ginkgonis TaxID=2695274 RepID=A0A7K1XTI7_9SPHI|nr:hypothetical protein [Hufsiella ginkgonis]MXV14250.1 hypothetical protein [Hufsiella ginkgonis]
MLLRLSHFFFGSSRSELQQLQQQGVPLTYEQKVKGDRMTMLLLIGISIAATILYSLV